MKYEPYIHTQETLTTLMYFLTQTNNESAADLILKTKNELLKMYHSPETEGHGEQASTPTL